MDDQVPCFKGKTATAYMELLDAYLVSGYPEGDEASQVSDPYKDVRAHSSDGACVFAYSVRHLLSLGYSLQDIEGRSQEVCITRRQQPYERGGLVFCGAPHTGGQTKLEMMCCLHAMSYFFN